jgi:eukaryotic-like serine/threonine-protein kinase
MDTTVADPLVGRLVDGRYQVVSKIARGGMASVYEAIDTRLDRPVALKVMHRGLAEDQAFVDRFIREARSAARLSDPGVVAVYDQGKDPQTGLVFLAMELVRGRTLRDVVRSRGRLTPGEALDIMTPVLSALAAAHRAGIVHRDVKPENVLLADDGRVKVADFGLARSQLASGADSSTQGVVMGTVAYLSPEQVETGRADARSDVYSAGILLFELLTGAPPFAGDTPMSVAYQHVTTDVPPPSTVVPGLAPALDGLVLAATDRDPQGRPADAAAYLQQVRTVRGGLTAAQLGYAPADVDLTETLVVPLPGAAGAVGIGALAAAGAHHPTTAMATATAPAPPGVLRRPDPPKVGGPGRMPTAARGGGSRRGALVGLLVLLLVAALLGVGGWYLGAGRYTTTPSVIGMTQTAATGKLESQGLHAHTGDARFSETVKAGLVVTTDPAPLDRVTQGGTVTLFLSKGPERYAVPKLAGKTVAEATSALQATHLTAGAQSQAYSETVPAGDVISTSPAAGTSVRRDTAIALVVSKGLAPATVPNFVGMTLTAAQAAATKNHLTLDSSAPGQYSTTVAQGSVVSQGTKSGTQVARGTTVDVVLSLGPPLVEVPNVFGMNKNDAKRTLQKAGFKVVFVDLLPGSRLNQVYSQSPAGGTKAPQGSTIRLGIV